MKTKIALIALVVLGLSACEPAAKIRDFPVRPKFLEDCQFARLTDADGNSITVGRCPNSTTTVVVPGKSPVTTITVDGVEYEQKK